MRVHARKAALVALSTALAACSVETGTVAVDVSCAAEGCGQSGVLHSRIEDCDEGTAFYDDRALAVAVFETSAHIGFGIENVEEGLRCVQVFLDVDSSGNLSAGDVLPSKAIHQGVDENRDDEDNDTDDDPEIDVQVVEDEVVLVDVVLNTVLQPEL